MENYRHGDLGFMGIVSLPNNLTETKTDRIIDNTSSGGNAHLFKNGKFYSSKKDNFVIGYFEALENCILLHKEHGIKTKGKTLREAKISKGFYEVRVQNEDTHTGMKQVVD